MLRRNMRKAARFMRCEGGYSVFESMALLGIIVVAVGLFTGVVQSGLTGGKTTASSVDATATDNVASKLAKKIKDAVDAI